MRTDSTIVTNDDMDRLAHLVRTLMHSPFGDQQQLELLDEVLQSADAMASEHVPIDVIRINSRFRVVDLDSVRRVQYTLVFPEDADISKGRLSILAPVGTALLGHRRGDVVEAKVPGGSRRLKIEHVLHRPASRTKRSRSGHRISETDLRLGLQSANRAA
jgi:regulator of nucleoside diphosphate kinase